MNNSITNFIEKECDNIISELGYDNIISIGSKNFQRYSDNDLVNNTTKEKVIRNNRYFQNNIRKWIIEKLSVAVFLNLHNQTNKNILDLGTGAGWFLYVCNRFGHTSLGTDILKRPEYELGYNFLNTKVIGELTFPMQEMKLDKTFDYITTMRSFIGQRPQSWSKKEWKFFLEDMYQYLNKDGILYLACNSGSKLDKRYKNLPESEKSFWGAKELGEWFEPYLISERDYTHKFMKGGLLIKKNEIKELLK